MAGHLFPSRPRQSRDARRFSVFLRTTVSRLARTASNSRSGERIRTDCPSSTQRRERAFDTSRWVSSVISPRCVSLLTARALAFGTMINEVQLWRLCPPRNPEVLRGHSPKGSMVRRICAGRADDRFRRGRPLGSTLGSRDGQRKATLRGHHSLVSSVAFAPDGRTLASGSFDTRLSDVDHCLGYCDIESTFFMRMPRQTGSSVAFHPDGRTLASVSGDLLTAMTKS